MNKQLALPGTAIEPPARAVRIRNAHAVATSAIERVAAGAELASPGWSESAVEAVRRFACHQVGLFTIEQARWIVQQQIAEPVDLRAWGMVTRMARARGYIERTNRSAPAYSSNNSDKPLYRRGANA